MATKDRFIADNLTGKLAEVDSARRLSTVSVLKDSSGNEIAVHQSGDGDYHLGVDSSIVGYQNPSRHAWITTTNAMMIAESTRLVGSSFNGTTKDAIFWAETGTANGGTVTQNGGITLKTSAATNGTAKYASVPIAQFVAGSENRFLAAARMTTAGIANNARQIGMYDVNEGFFFRLDGTTFSIGSRTGAVDTLVSSGSFNGNCGTTYVMNTAYHKLEIELMPVAAYFYVDGCLLHTLPGSLTATLNFPICFDNINDGNTTDIEFEVIATGIIRQGKLTTTPVSYYFADNTTAGVNLKIGSGSLHGIIISNCADNAVITLSDSISAATPVIWLYTSGKLFDQPVSLDFKGLPFDNGLRLTIADANASLTVIYE